MFQLFRPQPATATGCLDAALSMATGGLMLLSGAAGLVSAMQASQNADTAASGASDMTSVATATNTSLGPSTVAGASSNAAGVQVDPALLRDGSAGQVMSNFEKQFGIGRDQFANALASGESAQSILANAPSNAISPSDMAKATNAANNMSDADKAAALANSQMNDVQSELASKMGDNSYAANSKSGTGTTHSRSPASMDDLLAMGGDDASGGSGDLKVNPNIKSALAARDEAASKKSYADTSLFEVVHAKYREKMTMISGAGLRKGIGGPDGN